MNLAILVPVLGRPHRVRPLLESIQATSPPCRVLFLPDPDDESEINALENARAEWHAVEGKYAQKIRIGVEMTDEPLLFLGADDLKFRAGWFETAASKIEEGFEVVGVNDLIERDREHATHFLITREYAMKPLADGKLGPLCDEYHHWYCDDELIGTAKKRGVYVYEPSAVVAHLHHMRGTAPDDDTYRKGRANWRLDRNLFNHREPLWT